MPDEKRIVVRASRIEDGRPRGAGQRHRIPGGSSAASYRFYRVDQRLSVIPPVSLGLSIVDQIVRAHGGTITVEVNRARAALSPSVCRAPAQLHMTPGVS